MTRSPRLMRLIGATVLLTLLVALLVPLSAAAASPATGSLTAPVTGTFTDPATGSSGPFSGTLKVNNFSTQNSQLTANGTLSGVVTYTSGALAGTTQTLTSGFTAPAAVSGSCTILDLTIGPIHLD